MELVPATAETATLADYLRSDLQRIASSANEDLHAIGRGAGAYPARRAAEARVVNEARALAVRRVESTMRQLRQMRQRPPIQRPRPNAGRGNGRVDMDKTQVIPAVRDEPPSVDMDTTQVISAVRDSPPAVDLGATQVIPAVRDETPVIEQAPVISGEPPPEPADRQQAEDNARHRLRRAEGEI